MSAALALNCRTLEGDSTPAESLRVACAGCDPDNPRSVPRARCKKCSGTGVTPPEIVPIVGELRESRLELLKGGDNRRRGQDYDD
jgi:hypothetical protein